MSLGKCSWECLPSFQRDVTVYGNEVIEEAALILMIAIILKKKKSLSLIQPRNGLLPTKMNISQCVLLHRGGVCTSMRRGGGGSDWHKRILGIGMPKKYSTFPTITFCSLSCHFIVDSCVYNNKSKYEHRSNYDRSVWASRAQQGLISKLGVITITSLDGNFHVCCVLSHRGVDAWDVPLWERGSTFFFFSVTFPAILGWAACWFRVLFIENQYFPFLRMQNELLLRWALWRDWRLSLRHHSSEDFHKDIYFFSLGVNSANTDLHFSH